MANPLVANAATGVAGLLAVLWTVTLARPWTWICYDNSLVMFKINLHSIRIRQSALGQAAGLIAGFADWATGSKTCTSTLQGLVDHNLWMERGVQEFCSAGINAIMQWCNSWEMIKYASFIFLFLGFLTVLALGLGGGFLYYYAHHHPTHTGRMWIRVCFIAAPTCAWVGLAQYSLFSCFLAQDAGGRLETKSNYGPGFFIACVLTVATLLPFYLHTVFCKTDAYEKNGDNDLFMQDPGLANPNYGAAQPPSGEYHAGYGSYPAMQQPMPQAEFGLAPPVGSTYPPPMGATYPPPGSGAPAWS